MKSKFLSEYTWKLRAVLYACFLHHLKNGLLDGWFRYKEHRGDFPCGKPKCRKLCHLALPCCEVSRDGAISYLLHQILTSSVWELENPLSGTSNPSCLHPSYQLNTFISTDFPPLLLLQRMYRWKDLDFRTKETWLQQCKLCRLGEAEPLPSPHFICQNGIMALTLKGCCED